MGEASWAAAGMLAAEDPENPPQLAALAALSRSLYPEYLSTLARLSGRPVPLRTKNTLQASRPGEHFDCAATATRTSITPEEAVRRIPELQSGGRSFLWLDEWSLDPRDLCAALPLAAAEAGVLLEESIAVVSVTPHTDSVTITTSAGCVSAGCFVNCCGAWAGTVPYSPALPAETAQDFPPTVLPRKGQMVTVRLDKAPRLHEVLRTPEIYLVPRGDGRVVVGATVEDMGFDRRVEPAALNRLLSQAAALWPPIASGEVVESWSGLRPGTPNGLPLIGRAGSDRSVLPNCWLATGHYRNGILLAPATAAVLCQSITGQTPAISLSNFAADRCPPSRPALPSTPKAALK